MAWVAVSTRQLPGRPAPLESDADAVDQPLPGRGISLAPSPLHANHAKRPAGPVRPRHTCEGPTESNGNMGRVRCNSGDRPYVILLPGRLTALIHHCAVKS